METPKEYYYTYYSYEEWGMGYIGSRGCECLPEEDIRYFGSFKDNSFSPTQKIILEIYETREQALEAEVILHDFYDVSNNPHFANKSKQTSTKFYYISSFEEASKRGKINGLNHKQNKTGVCGRSKEKMSEDGRKGGKVSGKKTYELGIGIHALTFEERSEIGRKNGKQRYENKNGCFSITTEERKEASKKADETNRKNGTGIYGIPAEKRKEIGKRLSSQKWICLETGYVSNAGGLSNYQRVRGIDTSKRKRIE